MLPNTVIRMSISRVYVLTQRSIIVVEVLENRKALIEQIRNSEGGYNATYL